MNSGDPNTQFRAAMQVAAKFALVIGNTVAPPAGFIASSIFNLAALLNPWANEEGQTLSEMLEEVLSAKLIYSIS